MKPVYNFFQNPFVGIVIMSVALMKFVYSFDVASLGFYLAILQSIFMEYSLIWFFKKYRKEE
jgi:hypothetical protein